MLGGWGGGVLELYDYNCPVNVQGCDPSLGENQYSTISGDLAYVNPFFWPKVPPYRPPIHSYFRFGPSSDVPNAMSREWCCHK